MGFGIAEFATEGFGHAGPAEARIAGDAADGPMFIPAEFSAVGLASGWFAAGTDTPVPEVADASAAVAGNVGEEPANAGAVVTGGGASATCETSEVAACAFAGLSCETFTFSARTVGATLPPLLPRSQEIP